ncbi:crotonase/enoyl-CoA hydratase family protein [Thermodesulfobacteriota bacterium]
MSHLVTVSMDENVADVRLNRAEKYNALSPEMFAAIAEAGESLMNEKSVRAVVLSGEGRGFCAGLDFEMFRAMESRPQDPLEPGRRKAPNDFQLAAYIWKQLPVPVIAAVHGVAFGGGLQIALGADIRLASPDTRFSVMEIKWGLIPDMALTQTLRVLVPLDVAKELTFTGRIVGAEEAQRLGLVTRVCEDPRGEALKLAGEIASKSPDAIRAGKKLLENTWHAGAEQGLLLEERLQVSLFGTANQVEAVTANLENRPPVFKDPE